MVGVGLRKRWMILLFENFTDETPSKATRKSQITLTSKVRCGVSGKLQESLALHFFDRKLNREG